MRLRIPFRISRQINPQNALIFFLVSLSLGLRIFKFGDIPGGMNQDEASTAYDAFAIGFFGIDRIGYRLPLFLVSWGSGMYALPAYAIVPFYYLFGVGAVSARLASLCISLFSLGCLAFVIKQYTRARTWVFPIFFASIIPWHFMQSRWLLDSNFFPHIFLFGFVLQLLSERKKPLLLASSALFGLSLYCYGTAYLVVPLYVGISLAFLWMVGNYGWRTIIGSGVVFAAFALPVLWFVGVNSWGFPEIRAVVSIPELHSVPRYETSSINAQDGLRRIGDNARDLLNFLGRQDDGLLWNRIAGFGMTYVWSSIFSLLGFFVVLSEWKKKRNFLLLNWFACACVLGIALNGMNINRMNIIVFPLVFFTAIGLWFLRKNKTVFAAAVALYAIGFATFIGTYFWIYPREIEREFNKAFIEVLQKELVVHDGKTCITDNGVLPYIFTLYYGEISPFEYVETHRIENPGAEFETVTQFGDFTFGLGRCDLGKFPTVIARNSEVDGLLPQGFSIVFQNEDYSLLKRE